MDRDKGTTYIYGLTDPYTNAVVYIGKADNPQKRFVTHVRETIYRFFKYSYFAPSPKEAWIIKLVLENRFPGLVILKECDKKNWQEVEDYMIELHNYDELLNIKRIKGMGGGNGKQEVSQKRAWQGIKQTAKMLNIKDKIKRRYKDWLLTLDI